MSRSNNAPIIQLPGSKSISNRALILAFLNGIPFENLHGLSHARDTQLLIDALNRLRNENPLPNTTFDFIDAGTPSRFFLALCACIGRPCVITGNASLQNRSIESLVNVLSFGGCEIQYKNRRGHFPVELVLKGNPTENTTNPIEIAIDRSISSQFVSSMMLISCGKTLKIHLLGHAHSDSYIQMTASVMRDFGFHVELTEQFIIVSGNFNGLNQFAIEADWSSVSYFLNSMLFTDSLKELSFNNLNPESCQGDRNMIEFYRQLGLDFEFLENQLWVKRSSEKSQSNIPNSEKKFNHTDYPSPLADFDWDLGDIPDTVPSLVVALAVLKKTAYLRNIHNLVYKESNRIDVLNKNLLRLGFYLNQDSHAPNNYQLLPVSKNSIFKLTETNLPFYTHSDHRMAMAFAHVAKLLNTSVDDIECVEKSFPGFWQEFEKLFQNEISTNHQPINSTIKS